MIWDYLRRKVCNAILSGVQDAMQQLEGGEMATRPDTNLAALNERLRSVLLTVDTPTSTKEEPVPAESATSNGSGSGNGRKRIR